MQNKMRYSKKAVHNKNYKYKSYKHNGKKISQIKINKLYGGMTQSDIEENLDHTIDLETLTSDDNNFDNLDDLQKLDFDFKSELNSQLRAGRDEDVCKRHREMIHEMCPSSEKYKHTNQKIKYDKNSCLELYERLKDNIIIEINDVREIRKMKEYYRKCEESRTAELERECGKKFYNWENWKERSHRIARDKMKEFKDQCNDCLIELRKKNKLIEIGRQADKQQHIEKTIAQLKFEQQYTTEMMNDYLKNNNVGKQEYKYAARFIDMSEDEANAIRASMVKQIEEAEQRKNSMHNEAITDDQKKKKKKASDARLQKEKQEKEKEKLDEEVLVKAAKINGLANQIINNRINLVAAKVTVEKLKPDDKELLKSYLLTEENKSKLEKTGQYDSLISSLGLEPTKQIGTKGPKKGKKPSKNKSGKKKK